MALNPRNMFSIEGRLGKDPVEVPAGKATVTKFSIGVKDSRGSDSDKEPHTNWLNCEAWGWQGKIALRARKGMTVILQGDIRSDTYEKNGQTFYPVFLRVAHIRVPDFALFRDGEDEANGEEHVTADPIPY